jgi:hypothetical protein
MISKKKFKTLGLKDMHEDQLVAFMTLIEASLNLASECGEAEFTEMHEIAEDAIVLFGGVGIDVQVKADY